jgi:putative methyltransferase (TIGR04325 family)
MSEYSGPYDSWASAVKASVGFNSPYVLNKVKGAVIEVLRGAAKYERDGTAFPEMPPNMLREKINSLLPANGAIVDFGGGLGGTYINNVDIVSNRCDKYIIIEQQNFCIEGALIANNFNLPIKFMTSPADLGEMRIDMLIMSGVMAYIENWQEIISSLIIKSPEVIIVDRQILSSDTTKIMVQEINNYYEKNVSLPLQVINREYFLHQFPGYVLEEEWLNDFDPPNMFGFQLRRN